MISVEERRSFLGDSCKDCYMLGILAKDEDHYPGIGLEKLPVTVTRNGDGIIFYIKPISNDPEAIYELDKDLNVYNKNTVFIGFDNRIPNRYLPVGFEYKSLDTRIQIINDLLNRKVILFKPVISYEKEKNRYHKNLDIISIEQGIEIESDTQFIPVPTVAFEPIEFEDIIRRNKALIMNQYSHGMPDPEFIICEDYLYFNFEPVWTRDSLNKKAWGYPKPQDIKKVKINAQDLAQKSIKVSENLMFIEKKFLFDLQAIKQDMDRMDNYKVRILDGNHDSVTVSHLGNDYLPLELDFVDSLEKEALNQGLCYDFDDLVNFHICVKTSCLTVLSGLSGIGKTQLALTYARALGLSHDEGTLLVLPVSPSYTEPGDLIGYLNTGTGLFIPSETGFIDFLINAKVNKDRMHMVIFDEMNLSQVEHWFAPFISILELKGEDRKLRLYSDINCHNGIKYPRELEIGDNILFVGTINLDETTKDLSDRLLDRANVINPVKISFQELKIQLEQFSKSKRKDMVPSEPKKEFCLTKCFRGWANTSNYWEAFEEQELEFFDKLHTLIQNVDQQKGISFRTLGKIGTYLKNIPRDRDRDGNLRLSREKALDIQIKQRILTKIRGSVEQFGDLIGSHALTSEEIANSSLLDFIINEGSLISDFSKTILEIKRKARELHFNGYTN